MKNTEIFFLLSWNMTITTLPSEMSSFTTFWAETNLNSFLFKIRCNSNLYKYHMVLETGPSGSYFFLFFLGQQILDKYLLILCPIFKYVYIEAATPIDQWL